MKGLNKATLMGNVGRDPEIRYIEENVAVCTLPLATSENYTNKTGERITQTEWHNVVFWRGLAEIVEKYVKKGDPLYVEGRIRTRSYQDKDNPNVTRYTTEIVASDIRLLSSRGDNSGSQSAQPTNSATQQSQPVQNHQAQQPAAQNTVQESPAADSYEEDDDLPF